MLTPHRSRHQDSPPKTAWRPALHVSSWAGQVPSVPGARPLAPGPSSTDKPGPSYLVGPVLT